MAISNYGLLLDSLYEQKIGEDLVFNNSLPKSLTITKIACLKAKPKLRKGMVYRQFIMIPVVVWMRDQLCVLMYYDLGHGHSNLGKFKHRFVMQKFRFSVPPLLPRFPSSNVISSWSIISIVFLDSWVYNGALQPYISSCTVDYTLISDDHFWFALYIRGHVPGGWICYQCSSREGPLVISTKISPNTKTGAS